jgi:pilus assembly protein Flp/PilA
MMVGLIRARSDLTNPPEGETPMLKNALKLFRDEEGATAVEYGLIVAAIAGLIIAVVFVLGKKVNNTFNNVQAAMP